jgi:hypothetical protein
MSKIEEVKAVLANLDERELRRVVLEVLPDIWPKIVGDAACVQLLRKLVDEASVNQYQEDHLDHF